jgi:DoxX-like protein
VFIAVIVLSILLAVAFLGAGGSKLAGVKSMRESAEHLGFSFPAYRGIGALEVAGAAGLLIGLAWAPLGVAAAAGLTLLMIGAVTFHLRAKDSASHYSAPAVLAVLSLVALVLRILA